MKGHAKIAIVLLACALSTKALQTSRVLHIPEKIIGGVIDIVQSHKNKPTTPPPQPGFQGQGQSQQQVQQGYGWNYQGQAQSQAQYQYGNQGYPQTGNNYPQGSYGNAGQGTGSGYQQFGGSQGHYQNYPQNQSGGHFDGQQSQFQSQVQNGYQGQQSQIQIQNQQFQNQQNGQYPNQSQQTNVNFQGAQHVSNQQIAQNQATGSYGGSQQASNFVTSPPTGSYGGQGQPSNNYGSTNNYGGSNQGQVPQTTFVGTNQHHTQTGGSSHGGSQAFQMTTGSTTGVPGPTCVCQAWSKPTKEPMRDTPSQKNEDEKPELSAY